MAKRILIIYVPGLGDDNLTMRQRVFGLWFYRNVSVEICAVGWSTSETWTAKLGRLSAFIQSKASSDVSITLVGESAGAAAAIQAFAANSDIVDGVVLICGKTQYADKLGAEYRRRSPALVEAVSGSSAVIATLTNDQKSRILSLRPIYDPIVVVAETKITGVKSGLIPMVGHAASIAFAITLWSWRIARHAKKSAKQSSDH